MDLGLQGKLALVTGSTAGIGLAIARGLAREGAAVIVNGRSRERVNAAVAEVERESRDGRVTGVVADLGTADGAIDIVREYPDVDILVNNVGIYNPVAFADIDDDEWLRTFEVNVMSGVRLGRAYLHGMLSRNWGRIVFISSESGVNIPAEMIHYGVSKSCQIALSRGLAELTAGTGVTVNAVLPGPTRSEGVGVFLERMAEREGKDIAALEKEVFEKLRPSSLIRRFASPDEVASMVVYVCSSAASATNGAALRVEGGILRSIL